MYEQRGLLREKSHTDWANAMSEELAEVGGMCHWCQGNSVKGLKHIAKQLLGELFREWPKGGWFRGPRMCLEATVETQAGGTGCVDSEYREFLDC